VVVGIKGKQKEYFTLTVMMSKTWLEIVFYM